MFLLLCQISRFLLTQSFLQQICIHFTKFANIFYKHCNKYVDKLTAGSILINLQRNYQIILFCVSKFLLILESGPSFNSQSSFSLPLYKLNPSENLYTTSRVGKNEWALVYNLD